MINKPLKEVSIIDFNEMFYTGQLEESQTIELKKQLSLSNNGRPDNKEFAKDITALSNSEGGFLIIGVDEEQEEICGASLKLGNQKIEDWIANVLNDLVDKTIKYELKILYTSENNEEGIVIIEVFKGEDKPYYVLINKKPIPYIRKGTSVFTAKPSDLREMYATKKVSKKITKNTIKQTAKGKSVQQIGQNFGKIINTQKVQNVTEVKYEGEKHITSQQAKAIKDKVDEIVQINLKTGKHQTPQKLYQRTWSGLKNKFKIPKYTLLEKERFDECMQWLQSQIAYNHRPKLRSTNKEEWRKEMYKAIYTKSRSKNMEKEDLLEYAFQKLGLKKPISSLKDLSDTRLNKLYRYLYSN